MSAPLKTINEKYKGRFPFRLSCPSFIYPAGYAENVRLLGACVDEIELLFFESDRAGLPPINEISELKRLAGDLALTYNVHLPTDISISTADAGRRETAIQALLTVIDRAHVLEPVSWTLHVPGPGPDRTRLARNAWQGRLFEGVERLLTQSGLPAAAFSLETLDYPFGWLDGLINRFGFSVCMDTGHLMLQGQNCLNFYHQYQNLITIIHAHGVDSGRDHLALNRLNPPQISEIGPILRNFRHTLSLEVFNADDLAASLDSLNRIWDDMK